MLLPQLALEKEGKDYSKLLASPASLMGEETGVLGKLSCKSQGCGSHSCHVALPKAKGTNKRLTPEDPHHMTKTQIWLLFTISKFIL